MRLINVDAIVHYQTYDDEHEEFQEHESTIAEFLDKMTDEGCPNPVDAAPVRRGRWEWDGEAFVCSACGSGYKGQPTMMGEPMFEFCPVCGADMRKGGEGND